MYTLLLRAARSTARGRHVHALDANSWRGHDRQKDGIVKWFNDAKGSGFITPDDRTGDLYVSFKSIESSGYSSLTEGQRVSFVVVQGQNGRQADQVRPE